MKWNWIMLPNDTKFPLHQLINYIAKFVKYVLTIWVTWQCLIRGRNCLLFASIWVHPRCLVGSMLFIVLVLCVVLLCFVCLCPVSCVPNVTSVSGLSCVLCAQCCQCLWIAHSWLTLRFSPTFICKLLPFPDYSRVRVAQPLVICVVFVDHCFYLFFIFLLATVLSRFRFAASGYPLSISKFS